MFKVKESVYFLLLIATPIALSLTIVSLLVWGICALLGINYYLQYGVIVWIIMTLLKGIKN